MSDLTAKDKETRVARSLRAAWYRLPDCPGELYASEARALAKAAIAALADDKAEDTLNSGTLGRILSPEADGGS